MGGGDSSPPQYNYPAPQAPDPYKTADAQSRYNIEAAKAQAILNNTNQVTPYGDITYTQTGEDTVGYRAPTAATAATGGYWNGYAWVPTGGSAGDPGSAGYKVPRYTATTKLSPLLQSLVDQSIYNARGVGGLETDLIGQLKGRKPLDLSWGNIANKIYGYERQTLDPYWGHSQELMNQKLADQGLTAGSEGWKYAQTQYNQNKADAYTNAMLAAQGQAASDIQAEYASPYNTLASLRSSAQIVQPGVGQTAQTNQGNIAAAPYAGVATSNYQTGAGIYNSQQQLQERQYEQQQQQQQQMLGGLFGLGGQLLQAIPLFSDRRDKTDIKRLGIEPETKLPLYSYRYKDDPKTYPKVVGPMAQDVEEKYPGNVGEVGGHKVIFGLGA